MAEAALPLKIRLRRQIGRAVYSARGPRRPGRAIRILSYHEITGGTPRGDWAQMCTPRPLFEAHLQWLMDAGYRAVTAETAAALLRGQAAWPSERVVALTFDDGLRSFLTEAWPCLERLGLPGTLCVATDLLEQDPAHLRWSELRGLTASGLVSCAAHSVTHRKLRGLPRAELARELRGSKRRLEDELQQPVATLAYPYGSYDAFDAATIAEARAAGFTAAMTTIAGINRPGADLFRLRRTRISWVDALPEFHMAMGGAFDWYAAYQRVAG